MSHSDHIIIQSFETKPFSVSSLYSSFPNINSSKADGSGIIKYSACWLSDCQYWHTCYKSCAVRIIEKLRAEVMIVNAISYTSE